jgi:hypothetical protein
MKTQFPELSERFAVFAKVQAPDDFGGIKETWEEVNKIWAQCAFAAAKEITGKTFARLLQSCDGTRRGLYLIKYRHQITLPPLAQLRNATHALQIISEPFREPKSLYTTVYGLELRGAEWKEGALRAGEGHD